MKKIVLLMMLTVMLVAQSAMAQVAEGIKSLNYQKFNNARELLKKAYDADPKDPQAVYWYGQALLAGTGGTDISKEQVAAAKAVYQKGLQDIGSDAWLLVGMGHVEILEGGDINSAKQKFEQAITATTETRGRNKGKPNPAILNAIGRANADGGSKFGDPAYAIDKLKQAAAIDATNADIYVNMGVNYLKLGGENGGEAVKAYQEAINRDPKNAIAMWRIGNIYKSQNNKDLLEQYYNNAIAADPSFPPPYYALYEYYADKDVNRAKEYLDKFVANADKDPRNDVFLADYLFRAGKYSESLAKAKEIEASIGTDKLPILNAIYAYNYDRTGDSVQAKSYLEKFFTTAKPDQITPGHYELAVKVYSKFPGDEDKAAGFIEKAIQADTVTVNRLNYIKMASDMYAKAKNPKSQLAWLKRGAEIKKDLAITDYYYLVDATLKTADLEADSTAKAAILTDASKLSTAMIQKFPDQIYGYNFATRAAIALDRDTTTGSAVPAVEQYIAFLSKDPAKNSVQLPRQFYYLASYYHDKAKDYEKTLDVINKLLTLYPEDKYGLQVKPIVEKELSGPTKTATPAKQGNAGGGTGAAATGNKSANGTNK